MYTYLYFLIIIHFTRTSGKQYPNETRKGVKRYAEANYTRWKPHHDITPPFVVRIYDNEVGTGGSRLNRRVDDTYEPIPTPDGYGNLPMPANDEVKWLHPANLDDNDVVQPHGNILENSDWSNEKNPGRDESPPLGPLFVDHSGYTDNVNVLNQKFDQWPINTHKQGDFGRTTYNEFPTRTTSDLNNIVFHKFEQNNMKKKDNMNKEDTYYDDPEEITTKKVTHNLLTRTSVENLDMQRPTIGFRKSNYDDSEREYTQNINQDEVKEITDKVLYVDESESKYEPVKKIFEVTTAQTIDMQDIDIKFPSTADKTSLTTEASSVISTFGESSPTSTASVDDSADVELMPSPAVPNITRFCGIAKTRPLQFNQFATLSEIFHTLQLWKQSPLIDLIDITNGNLTVMENPVYLVIVDDPSTGQGVHAKETVMIVGGVQGRDHFAVMSAMYIIYTLINKPSTHSTIHSKFRFLVIPVLNPDGFDYSMTFPRRRGWNKNLRQRWVTCKNKNSPSESCKACEEYGFQCVVDSCYGVNLDRNFEYQWIPETNISFEEPCSDSYVGPHQLSETETYALTFYLHEQRANLNFFIALKENDVLGVLYPHSHTKLRREFDEIYRQRAVYAAYVASQVNNRKYVAGQTSEYIPVQAGGLEDWIHGHLSVENTYSVNLYRISDMRNKYSPDRVAQEAFAAVQSLLMKETVNKEETRRALKQQRKNRPTRIRQVDVGFKTAPPRRNIAHRHFGYINNIMSSFLNFLRYIPFVT